MRLFGIAAGAGLRKLPCMTTASPPVEENAASRSFSLMIFVLLILVWGLLWPFMKIAVAEMSVLSFRAISSVLAAITMLIVTRIAGHSLRVPRDHWVPLIIAGLFNVGAWLYLSAVGVTMIEAGRASLIAYTMPVWAFLMGIPLLGEKITRWRVLGLVLAMAGLAVLMGDEAKRLGEAPFGALVMVAASLCFAFGTVWQKYNTWRVPHLTVMSWQMVVGAAPITVLAIPDLLVLQPVSWQATAATLYAGLIAQVFGVAAYLWLVKRLPVKTASLSVMLVPLVGLGSSAILLGESLGLPELLATGLILGAIATVFPKDTPRTR